MVSEFYVEDTDELVSSFVEFTMKMQLSYGDKNVICNMKRLTPQMRKDRELMYQINSYNEIVWTSLERFILDSIDRYKTRTMCGAKDGKYDSVFLDMGTSMDSFNMHERVQVSMWIGDAYSVTPVVTPLDYSFGVYK